MPDAQDAQKAITGLHDSVIPNTDGTANSKLYVAYLENKAARQARLKSQISENVWRPNNYYSNNASNNQGRYGGGSRSGGYNARNPAHKTRPGRAAPRNFSENADQ